MKRLVQPGPPPSASHLYILSKLCGQGVKSQVSPQGQKIVIYWADPVAWPVLGQLLVNSWLVYLRRSVSSFLTLTFSSHLLFCLPLLSFAKSSHWSPPNSLIKHNFLKIKIYFTSGMFFYHWKAHLNAPWTNQCSVWFQYLLYSVP